MKSILYAIPFLLGAAVANAQIDDRQTSPAEPGTPWPNDMYVHHHGIGKAFAAIAGDRQTSPIANANAKPELRQGQDDVPVYTDMYYHHHPSKAFAAGSPRLAADAGNDVPVYTDMYYHHHPSKAFAAGSPRLAADAGHEAPWPNDMYLHHHKDKAMALAFAN